MKILKVDKFCPEYFERIKSLDQNGLNEKRNLLFKHRMMLPQIVDKIVREKSKNKSTNKEDLNKFKKQTTDYQFIVKGLLNSFNHADYQFFLEEFKKLEPNVNLLENLITESLKNNEDISSRKFDLAAKNYFTNDKNVALFNQEYQIPFEIKNKGTRILDIKNLYLAHIHDFNDPLIYEYADISFKKYVGERLENKNYLRLNNVLRSLPIFADFKFKKLENKITKKDTKPIFEAKNLNIKTNADERVKYIPQYEAEIREKIRPLLKSYELQGGSFDKKYLNKNNPEIMAISKILTLFAGDSRLKKDYRINS